jgi:hypothetical protein
MLVEGAGGVARSFEAVVLLPGQASGYLPEKSATPGMCIASLLAYVITVTPTRGMN